MGARSLGTCLQEAVDNIRRITNGTEIEEWFDMEPNHSSGRTPELHYWVGYLQGVADGLDMTVREVLNEHSINYSNDGES